MKHLNVFLKHTKSSRGVIYIWTIVALTIFVVALLWFILDTVVSPMYDIQLATYPTEMADPGVTFLNSLWTYWPIVALLGLGIWVYVMSQKRRVDDLRGE